MSYSMTLLFLGAGISLWIWVSQVSFHVTWQHMSPLLYGCAILGIFWATAKWLVSVLGRKWDIIKKHGADITACSVVLACIAAYVLVGVAVFRQPELPLQIVGFFVLIVVVLIAFIREIFSQDMKKEVTIVQKPSTLSRWIDLYSSADPVPSGRTLTKESKDATESVEISNMGSVFADHTAYWDNLDEFVLRVVKECAETANSPWKTDLPTGISNVKERAVWRVRCLRLARSTVFITWLSVAGIVAFRHGAVNMPFELLHGWVPGWLEAMAKRTPPVAFLEVLIVLAFFGTSALIRLPWRYWVHKEQTTLLEGKPPGASWFVPLAAMGIVVWSAVVFAYTTARVASHGLASVSAFRTEPDFLALVAANILFFAVASTLLLRRLLPTNHERKNSRLRLHYPQ